MFFLEIMQVFRRFFFWREQKKCFSLFLEQEYGWKKFLKCVEMGKKPLSHAVQQKMSFFALRGLLSDSKWVIGNRTK